MTIDILKLRDLREKIYYRIYVLDKNKIWRKGMGGEGRQDFIAPANLYLLQYCLFPQILPEYSSNSFFNIFSPHRLF